MKVVLDTNVLVSGLLTRDGTCAHVLRLVLAGVLQLCADARILDEYERVLRRPLFQIPPDDVTELLDLLRLGAEVVTPPPLAVELPDPDDVAFAELAADRGAVLVTGNLRHFPGAVRERIVVTDPAGLLDGLRRPS